ncbi:hypothetical protein DFH11DRAFT_740534 [Phellopilus nigrolimitatus]|nr:hypothetical protein DFH11DRAFT_740534 [Phellopilus nigrolimitatus]
MSDDSDGVQEHVGDGEDPMEVESEEEVLPKEVPPSRQAVNLEDRRRALLEDCAFSGIVEPRRVYCVVCKVWIGLTSGSYSPGNWNQHLKAKTHRSAKYRRRCVGSFYDDNTAPPSRKPSSRASTRTTMPSRTPAREGGHHRLGILTRLGAATQNNQDAREASGSRPSHDGSAQQASETIQTAPLQPRTANSVSSGPSSASASSNETRRTDGSNPATTAGPRPAEGHVRAETVDGQHRQMNFNVPEGVAHMTISLNFTHV